MIINGKMQSKLMFCCLMMLLLLHNVSSGRLPKRRLTNMSVFVHSSSNERRPLKRNETLLSSGHKDTWTGPSKSNLARTRKPIIRPISNSGKYVEQIMNGVMLLAEVGKNEVFVPEELISSTKELLTKVPQRLKNLKTSLAFGEKRPVRRHVTGTMMKGMPFSFQYIVDDEQSLNFQTRQETKDSQGVVRGCYQVLEPEGLVRTVTYRADVSGFRVVDITKGPDRIPCSGSDREDFQTPFQRDIRQMNFGKTLNFNSENEFPKKTQDKTRSGEINKKVKTKNRQKPFEPNPAPVVPSNRKQMINSPPTPQRPQSFFSSEVKSDEKSVVSIINDLSKTLLNSFKSSQSHNELGNYINFPFVLIPISTFFQLKRDGHIDDSVQGFGAVIQPTHLINKNGLLTPDFRSLQNFGQLFPTLDSVEFPKMKSLGSSQFSLEEDYETDSSIENDYSGHSFSDPSSSYSQVSQTVMSNDGEISSNFNSVGSQTIDSLQNSHEMLSNNEELRKFKYQDDEPIEDSSYINYEKLSSEKFPPLMPDSSPENRGSFEIDYFAENSFENKALDVFKSENDLLSTTFSTRNFPSTVNGFAVPAISDLPLQDSSEQDLSVQLSSFPPTFRQHVIDQESSGTMEGLQLHSDVNNLPEISSIKSSHLYLPPDQNEEIPFTTLQIPYEFDENQQDSNEPLSFDSLESVAATLKESISNHASSVDLEIPSSTYLSPESTTFDSFQQPSIKIPTISTPTSFYETPQSESEFRPKDNSNLKNINRSSIKNNIRVAAPTALYDTPQLQSQMKTLLINRPSTQSSQIIKQGKLTSFHRSPLKSELRKQKFRRTSATITNRKSRRPNQSTRKRVQNKYNKSIQQDQSNSQRTHIEQTLKRSDNIQSQMHQLSNNRNVAHQSSSVYKTPMKISNRSRPIAKSDSQATGRTQPFLTNKSKDKTSSLRPRSKSKSFSRQPLSSSLYRIPQKNTNLSKPEAKISSSDIKRDKSPLPHSNSDKNTSSLQRTKISSNRRTRLNSSVGRRKLIKRLTAIRLLGKSAAVQRNGQQYSLPQSIHRLKIEPSSSGMAKTISLQDGLKRTLQQKAIVSKFRQNQARLTSSFQQANGQISSSKRHRQLIGVNSNYLPPKQQRFGEKTDSSSYKSITSHRTAGNSNSNNMSY